MSRRPRRPRLPGVVARLTIHQYSLRKQDARPRATSVKTVTVSRHLRRLAGPLFNGARNSFLRRRAWAVSRQSVCALHGKARTEIPQIGWNALDIVNTDCPLYRAIASGNYVYLCTAFYPAAVDCGALVARARIMATRLLVPSARQCFRHAISSEKKPEGRSATLKSFVDLVGSLIRLRRWAY